MSRTQASLGFDTYGDNYYEDFSIAKANEWGVLWLPRSNAEKQFIDPSDRDHPSHKVGGFGYYERRNIVDANNWHSWRSLRNLDRQFFFSLLWIPERELLPLEALAQAAG